MRANMYFTIYKITNKANNKTYIGKHQTKDLNDGYMGSGKLIRRAIIKHGIENFEKQILYVFDNEAEMNAKERELVDIVSESSYNLVEGGKGGFGYINRNKLGRPNFKTPDVQKRATKTVVARLKEKYLDPKERELLVVRMKYMRSQQKVGSFKGKNHTEATKKKLADIAKINSLGEKNSQFGTCWITNGKENKKVLKEKLDYWKELGYNQGRIIRV